VKVHYEGRTVDGKEFDSSYKRGNPTSFNCNQVIKGWTEALTHMPVGSIWEVYIPYKLAYGERGAGDDIKPYSMLIFKIELLGIED
jgi:FKBP-type peptidyl-prolyl cis-trans isomerase FklB